MDLQTFLLCLAIVIVSTVLIWFILVFSTRGQSYEEAVAENRRLAVQRGLLDDPAKAKKKQQQSKKEKKAGKKVKEKQAKEQQQVVTSNSEVESDGQVESSPEEEPAPSKPQHVEFVEEPAVVVVSEVIPPKPNKAKSKKGKEPKVKPILINKDDSSCITDMSTPPSPTVAETVNHFEQIHPKDEFEMLHSNDKDGKEKKDSKAWKHPHGKGNKGKQQETQKESAKPKEPEPTPVPKPEKQPESQEAPKEQRKGKKSSEKTEVVEKPSEVQSVSSSATISQPSNLTTDKILKQAYPLEGITSIAAPVLASGDTTTLNGPTQPPQGKKKKNIQLHQLTMGGDGLNVNLLVKLLGDAPMSRSEIQILTDCLLNKQNGPLPEHSEWSEGPKDPVQKLKRQLTEKEKALTDEQEAHQALKGKLKELRAQLNSEHAKVSQLLTSAEDATINHRNDMAVAQARLQRAMDEANLLRQQLLQLQKKLSVEADSAAQRSQMEMHIQALSENKASLTSALGALQAEVSDLRGSHSGLTGELHMAREQLMATQHHTQEMSRQIEELNRINADLDAQLVNTVRSEQFIKQELHQANERLKGFNDAQAEIQRLSSAHNHAQKVTMHHEKKQEELDRQNQQLTNNVTKLKSENEELNSVVKDLKEKLASQSTPNGTTTPVKEDTVSIQKAVAAACSELETKHSQQIDNLQRQLDQHRDKNNDLRTKNWKVMDALQAAEKKIQSLDKGEKATDDTTRDAIKETKFMEQKNTKEVLQRLLPKVDASGSSHEEWLQNFAGKVQQQINAVKPQSVSVVNSTPNSTDYQKSDAKLKEMEKTNSQLQGLVDKYKQVIDDTEGVLSRLQSNVTEEEQRWAKQLAEKQQELDSLKKHSISQLKDKIESLQDAYDKEHKIRLELEERGKGESNAFLSAIIPKSPSYPVMADMEKLKEENARLTELVERLHHNGPSQLPSIPTLEKKTTKKRRSITGWFRRKITFRRKKNKDTGATNMDRRKSTGDEAMENLARKSSDSYPSKGNKTL